MQKNPNITFPDFNGKSYYKFGVFADNVSVPDKYICKKGAKEFSRLFYVVQGSIIFNKNTTKTIRASKSDIVYLPTDIEYESEWDNKEDGKYISVNFILEEFNVKMPHEICIIANDTHGLYYEMFREALSIWEKGALGYKLELLSHIYKIFYHIYLNNTYENLKNKVIYNGMLYLENHYLEDITTQKLADMCNTSESSFRRYFKKEKNMSPITYRNHLRIKKAYELIMSGEYNVSEVAAIVNIPDICYFNKLFKRTYNISPGSLLNNSNS